MSVLSSFLASPPGRVARRIIDYPAGPIEQLCETTSPAPKLPIPSRVIQTWEVNSFGRRHRQSLLKFRALNPDFEFKLFTRADRDQFMTEFSNREIAATYFSSRFKPLQVDLFRYSYLYVHGGFYFDISMAVDKPLASFMTPEATAVLTLEKNNSVFAPPSNAFSQIPEPLKLFAIWGFGFTPGHRILEIALSRIQSQTISFMGKTFENPKDAIISFTGPALFTSAVWEYLNQKNDPNVVKLVNDFMGHGSRVQGAGYRHLDFPSYAQARNQSLLV
jgi:mannosyltransferase OCH1-like enzyme